MLELQPWVLISTRGIRLTDPFPPRPLLSRLPFAPGLSLSSGLEEKAA